VRPLLSDDVGNHHNRQPTPQLFTLFTTTDHNHGIPALNSQLFTSNGRFLEIVLVFSTWHFVTKHLQKHQPPTASRAFPGNREPEL
jgi:hypothetical protein